MLPILSLLCLILTVSRLNLGLSISPNITEENAIFSPNPNDTCSSNVSNLIQISWKDFCWIMNKLCFEDKPKGVRCVDSCEIYIHGITWKQHCQTSDQFCVVTSENPVCQEAGLCAPNPCMNGGLCEHFQGSYRCKCPDLYTGKDCQSFDPCASSEHECSEGSTCNSVNSEAKCVCDDLALEYNEEQKKCQGWCHEKCKNGECQKNQDRMHCKCEEGWTGVLCDEKINLDSVKTKAQGENEKTILILAIFLGIVGLLAVIFTVIIGVLSMKIKRERNRTQN